MQVFRLVGLPDKIIAFDELPEEMVKGFEDCRAEGFPKAWKKWMGEREIVTPIPSELNPVTGVRRTFDPYVEKDSFFYKVDWDIKPMVERWEKIEKYARDHVKTEFRLTDKLEDMAKPLAPDKISGITLDPEDVIVIPIPKEVLLVDPKDPKEPAQPELPIKEEPEKETSKETELMCPHCKETFEGSYAKNSLRFHMRKHEKEKVTA